LRARRAAGPAAIARTRRACSRAGVADRARV